MTDQYVPDDSSLEAIKKANRREETPTPPPSGQSKPEAKKKYEKIKIVGEDGQLWEFDSWEEVHFFYWLEEAQRAGYVLVFRKGKSIKIADGASITARFWQFDKKGVRKVKELKRNVFQDMHYTPDFEFCITQKFLDEYMTGNSDEAYKINTLLMYGCTPEDLDTSTGMMIDIKGAYVLKDRHAQFNMRRKMVWQVYKRFVREIEPKQWFTLTWVPFKAAFTDKTKRRCANYAMCQMLGESLRRGSAMSFVKAPGEKSHLPDASELFKTPGPAKESQGLFDDWVK